MADLLDASVWLPLSAPDHVHYERVRRYWDEESAEELLFCRLTALALLRHLTNPKILGPASIDGPSAWQALRTWLSEPRVSLSMEPSGLEARLDTLSGELDLRGGHWTDAYLASFAVAGGYRLVTFDRDFHKFSDLNLLHLDSRGVT
jgi:toxin-antitoxin system PIN domain toxin